MDGIILEEDRKRSRVEVKLNKLIDKRLKIRAADNRDPYLEESEEEFKKLVTKYLAEVHKRHTPSKKESKDVQEAREQLNTNHGL